MDTGKRIRRLALGIVSFALLFAFVFGPTILGVAGKTTTADTSTGAGFELRAAIVAFGLGLLVGYAIATSIHAKKDETLRRGVALMVATLWGVSVIWGMVTPAYTTSVFVHSIMGGTVGYLIHGERGGDSSFSLFNVGGGNGGNNGG